MSKINAESSFMLQLMTLSWLSKIQSFLSNLFPFLASPLSMRGRQSPDILLVKSSCHWHRHHLAWSWCLHNNQLYLAMSCYFIPSRALLSICVLKLYFCEASKITVHSSSSYSSEETKVVSSCCTHYGKNNQKRYQIIWSSLSLAL